MVLLGFWQSVRRVERKCCLFLHYCVRGILRVFRVDISHATLGDRTLKSNTWSHSRYNRCRTGDRGHARALERHAQVQTMSERRWKTIEKKKDLQGKAEKGMGNPIDPGWDLGNPNYPKRRNWGIPIILVSIRERMGNPINPKRQTLKFQGTPRRYHWWMSSV